MAGSVPHIRGTIAHAPIKIGRAVEASTWSQAGLLANWVQGRGRQLIPAHRPSDPSVNVLAAGSAYKYQWKTNTSIQAFHRAWVISAIANGTNATITVYAPEGAATGRTINLSSSLVGNPLVVIEDLAAQAAGEQTLTLKIAVDATHSGATIQSISCYELPRLSLEANATDDGADPSKLGPRSPIDDATNGWMRPFSASELADFGVRGALASWATPYDKDAAETTNNAPFYTTSTSYVPIWDSPSGGMPILGRMKAGAATSPVRIKALLKTSNALGIASCRVTLTSSGASAAVTTSSTTWVWSSALDVDVDASNFSHKVFLRAGAWDIIVPQLKTNNASYTAYCAAVCAWED